MQLRRALADVIRATTTVGRHGRTSPGSSPSARPWPRRRRSSSRTASSTCARPTLAGRAKSSAREVRSVSRVSIFSGRTRRPACTSASTADTASTSNSEHELCARSVIVSAVRTPTGKFLGALKDFTATELGALRRRARPSAAPASIRRSSTNASWATSSRAGLGQNPARQAALNGGLADHVAALTINKVCGSGLKAVMLAAQGIATGDIDIAVAGGMESMSNCPVPAAARARRAAHGQRRQSSTR